MRLGAVSAPLGLAAVAVVIAACAEPRSSTRLDRRADPLVWAPGQKLVAADSAELDELGRAVSLGTDRALLGAYGESFYRGAAYVFVDGGNAWTQEQKLVAGDGAASDYFGFSVSLTDDRALVGAYGAGSSRGAAYIFVRTGSSWTEEQELLASDGVAGDNFGYAVSLSGSRALVGAFGSDAARGAAYVFVRSGSSWTEEQELLAGDGVAGDNFGFSVSLADDRAVVGSPGAYGSRGAAHVFVLGGGATDHPWTEEQELVASDGVALDNFGIAVSLADDGATDRALVGAYWNDDLRGAAYVFARNGGAGEPPWTQGQKLVASDGAGSDRFGNAVSLSADRALIGATGRGVAYVFANGGSSWTEEQRLATSDPSSGLFGWSVALDADRALVGASYTDQLRGAAYLFSLGLSNGDPCSAGAACASGYCVDGLCCDRDCTGACGACSIAAGAAADGTCTVFAAGSEGSPPCAALACNGQSPACASCQSDADCPAARYCATDQTCQSKRGQGEACDDGSCSSGFCVDGVCCDAACDGLCQACTAKLKGNGDDGHCGPIAAGTDPEDECADDGIATCAGNGLCDGAGACQQYPSRTGCAPEPCTRGDQCTSGHCEDGICCDRACAPSERCLADLKVSGGDGACGPARAAALGATCKFDVQCTSGHCAADGTCVSASGKGGGDAGCACQGGGSPEGGRDWLGVALALLLLRRTPRSPRGPPG
jgi:hypothetical protein